jgi:hypothetical protein
MLKFLIILVSLGVAVNSPDQPFWTAHNNQITKELSAWSPTFAKAEYQKTSGTREFYRILDKAGETAGTLILTDAQGRFEKFDLMVVVDPANKISLIRILKYRSEFGSEITNKKWLAQFYNKPENTFVFRKNIDAVSGATFSTQGLINEINAIIGSLRSQTGASR